MSRWKPVQIVCHDCGGPARAPTTNTKYCRTCALGRQAQWHDGRAVPCPGCQRQYIPWFGQKGYSCGECFLALIPDGGREAVEGTCGRCKREGVVFTKDLALCYPCLYDPAHFESNRRVILRKYQNLIARHRAATLGKTQPPTEGAE